MAVLLKRRDRCSSLHCYYCVIFSRGSLCVCFLSGNTVRLKNSSLVIVRTQISNNHKKSALLSTWWRLGFLERKLQHWEHIATSPAMWIKMPWDSNVKISSQFASSSSNPLILRSSDFTLIALVRKTKFYSADIKALLYSTYINHQSWPADNKKKAAHEMLMSGPCLPCFFCPLTAWEIFAADVHFMNSNSCGCFLLSVAIEVSYCRLPHNQAHSSIVSLFNTLCIPAIYSELAFCNGFSAFWFSSNHNSWCCSTHNLLASAHL